MKQPAARRPIKYLHPSAFLLAAQFLLLILYAAVDDFHSARVLLSVFGSAVLVLLVWVVKRSPAVDWVAWILAVPAIFLTILTAFIADGVLLLWSSLLEAALYFYAAASLIAYMMEDYQVTTDELFAAGATFTLFAWGFTYLSLIVQTLAPGSFIGGLERRAHPEFHRIIVSNLHQPYCNGPQ